MSAAFNASVVCPILIGRDQELAASHLLLKTVKNGQGQSVLLSGEAGIGKSRLTSEVKTLAGAEGFQILQGNCFQADSSYPYAVLLNLLHSLLAPHPPTSMSAELNAFLQEVSQVLPDLALLFPDQAPAGFSPALSARQEQRRLFTLLTRFFTNQSLHQPMLLIVEDLHWCDDSSLEFLLHLARSSPWLPLLLFFTYRNDEISSPLRHWLAQLDRERLAQEIVLAPLSRSEVETMLQALVASPLPVETSVLTSIYTLTEGNPFFVEEVLTSLLTTGALRYVDGRWERKAEQGGTPEFSIIPRSVQDAVQQRVEHISPEAKRVLILAAITGRSFDFAVLHFILQCDEEHLLALIKELMLAQFVVEDSEDQFAFRHALTRQAVYNTLLTRERKSLHRTIAETLEQLYTSPSLREMHLADLAYHFYEAGSWSKALEYEQAVGEKALALYAPRTAAAHLTRALEAAHHLPLPPAARLYYARGEAYETLGEFAHAQNDYECALTIASAVHDNQMEWQSMMALGSLWAERDYEQTGIWLRRGVELAEKMADPNLQATGLNRLGNWLMNTGKTEEGMQAHRTALDIFERQQNKQGIAQTFDLLGIAYGLYGDRIKATYYLGEAIALFRTLGERQKLISSLAMRAVQSISGVGETILCALKTQEECMQDAEESLRLAREMDVLSGQSFAELALSQTFLSSGHFGPALVHIRESLRIATAINHQQWITVAYYGLGYIYLLLLAPDPAIAALETGLTLAHSIGSAWWVAVLTSLLSWAHRLNGNTSAAEAALRTVMPPEQRPRNLGERNLAWMWGELMLVRGEPEAALSIAEQLLDSVPGTESGQPSQPIPHLLKLKGEALVALARLDEAVLVLEVAKQGAIERHDRCVLWMIQRSLGRVYQLLRREKEALREFTAARYLLEELAATIDDPSLREEFLQAALDGLPREKEPDVEKATKQSPGGLTIREREVAALVAEGKTNREIADLLVVSERTAEAHVGNILRKLDFTSRAQIAVWAVEKGLTLS